MTGIKNLKSYLTAYQCLYMNRVLEGKGKKSKLLAAKDLIEEYPKCNDLLLIRKSTRILATLSKDKPLFEKAASSFKTLSEASNHYYYYDLLSVYSYLLDNKKEAVSYISTANSLAVGQGIAYSPFLNEIRPLIDK